MRKSGGMLLLFILRFVFFCKPKWNFWMIWKSEFVLTENDFQEVLWWLKRTDWFVNCRQRKFASLICQQRKYCLLARSGRRLLWVKEKSIWYFYAFFCCIVLNDCHLFYFLMDGWCNYWNSHKYQAMFDEFKLSSSFVCVLKHDKKHRKNALWLKVYNLVTLTNLLGFVIIKWTIWNWGKVCSQWPGNKWRWGQWRLALRKLLTQLQPIHSKTGWQFVTSTIGKWEMDGLAQTKKRSYTPNLLQQKV